MISARSIPEQIRTAAFLLTGVIPLSLLAGPVAAEAIASRQVDRLLEDLPGDAEISPELALQCRLISLVSDAVTLRAPNTTISSANTTIPSADTTISSSGAPDVASVAGPARIRFSGKIVLRVVESAHVRSLSSFSQEQPQGP
ncbi:MAG: hypothetical protein ACC655_08655 [Rhodothermia bacterium]